MAKRKNHLLEALKDGHSYTWTEPDGGDLASMRATVKHGETLTMSPVRDKPEPPPDVPTMLNQLGAAYQTVATRLCSASDESNRLRSIVDDLRWYADRIGSERRSMLPQLNKWSFDQHVWHLTKEAKRAAASDSSRPMAYHINHGKEHVGWIAELFALREYSEIEHSEV